MRSPDLRRSYLPLRSRARGYGVLEAIVFGMIAATAVVFFLTSTISSLNLQYDSASRDIGSQAARSVLEEAKSAPYAHLGFATTDANYRASWTHSGGTSSTITIPDPGHTNRLMPVRTVTVAGRQVTLRTDIVAATAPSGAASSWPMKLIGVTATWTTPGGTKTSTYTLHRSEPVDQVNRTDVPTSTVTLPPVAPSN